MLSIDQKRGTKKRGFCDIATTGSTAGFHNWLFMRSVSISGAELQRKRNELELNVHTRHVFKILYVGNVLIILRTNHVFKTFIINTYYTFS